MPNTAHTRRSARAFHTQKARRVGSALSLLLASVALAACGGSQEASKEASEESDTNRAVAGAAAGAVAGAVTGMGVSTADLPDFVELPPGAKAATNMKVNSNGKIGGTLSLSSKQSADEIVAFYKGVMERHDLVIGYETASAQVVQILGEAEDKSRMLMVMVMVPDEGDVQVSLTHSRSES